MILITEMRFSAPMGVSDMSSATKFKKELAATLATLPDYLLASIEESPCIFATSLGFSETVDTLPSGARFSFIDFASEEAGFSAWWAVAPAACRETDLESEAAAAAGARWIHVLPFATAENSDLDVMSVRDAGRLIELSIHLDVFLRLRYCDARAALGLAPEGLDAATTIRAAIASLRVHRSIEASAAAARAAISARAAEARCALAA